MSTEAEDIACFKHIRQVLAWSLRQLDIHEVPKEHLAEFIPASRVLGFDRRAKLVPVGEVWHLGVFLMNAQGVLFEYGSSTRAVPPGHPGHVSISQEQRREYRDAAFRSGFAEGAVVNFDAKDIDLDIEHLRKSTGGLFVKDGNALVRWRSGVNDDEAMPFETYMAERVELLVNPPTRSTDE